METLVKDPEKNLATYLECEARLHEFFKEVDFCGRYCPKMKEDSINGCCDSNHFRRYILLEVMTCIPGARTSDFAAVKLLNQRRLEKYGPPDLVENNGCGYHTEGGCRLEDHKSPLCVTYVCSEFHEYLQKEYGIVFPRFGLHYSEFGSLLEGILIGDVTDIKETDNFKSKIKGYTQRVREVKKMKASQKEGDPITS